MNTCGLRAVGAAALRAALCFVPLSSTSAFAQQQVPFEGDRVATVMTRNVYHGVDAEIDALPTAANFPDLLQKVAAVYQGYFTRNFPERANALAAEIEAKRPDLIGLQEAVLVRTQSPADGPATSATTVALDFVQILLDALAARGLDYEVVVQSINTDVELPSALGFDVRQTDREVILARADLKTADLRLSNAQGGNFTTNCTLPAGLLGPITFLRGWVAVDVKIRGKSFRLISTHLDAACLPFTSLVQQAQAAELLAGPAATELPVVLVGDLNSPGDGTGATYNNLTAAGFADTAIAAGAGSIPTCCQASDLLNAYSLLDHRSDYILSRPGLTVLDADVVGEEASDRTVSDLWPSDHAGVVATFQLPQP
jgi:endonuclease/exonuclease/phosphatase family metal-dependent hydrolase